MKSDAALEKTAHGYFVPPLVIPLAFLSMVLVWAAFRHWPA